MKVNVRWGWVNITSDWATKGFLCFARISYLATSWVRVCVHVVLVYLVALWCNIWSIALNSLWLNLRNSEDREMHMRTTNEVGEVGGVCLLLAVVASWFAIELTFTLACKIQHQHANVFACAELDTYISLCAIVTPLYMFIDLFARWQHLSLSVPASLY